MRYTLRCDMPSACFREFISYRIRAKASIYRNCSYAIISRLLCKHIAEFSVRREIMKLPFPSYKTTFTCDCTMQEAITRIQDYVEQNPWEIKMIDSFYDGLQNIVVESKFGEISQRNISLPVVKIKLKTVGEKTQFYIEFEFKYITKFYTVVYLSATLLFFLFYLVVSFVNRIYPDLLLVSIFVVFMFLFSVGITLSFKSSAKKFVLSLLAFLGYNDKDFLPQLQRVKFFNSKKE